MTQLFDYIPVTPTPTPTPFNPIGHFIPTRTATPTPYHTDVIVSQYGASDSILRNVFFVVIVAAVLFLPPRSRYGSHRNR
jgi:hypothetical protein